MKTQLLLIIPGIFISVNSFCQDSTSSKNKNILQNQGQIHTTITPAQQSEQDNPSIYDTRLGSSSPSYNTYEKNKNGAGGVTTDYHKSQGSGIPENIPPQHYFDTTQHTYRDTRLGSSSPYYNTYEKNNYGAGAVTTNPNKGGSSAPVFIPPASVSDTTAH